MPFVNMRIAGPVETGTVERLRREVTALMADVLSKRAELTAALVERVETGPGRSGAAPVAIAAHLAATVTAGTNTAEEKARSVAAAHALLSAASGGALPHATCVVIDEVPGEAWGYAGLTQAHRAGLRSVAG